MMLPGTFSLAWPGEGDDEKKDDEKKDEVRFKKLEAKRHNDKVKVWGVLVGKAWDIEVKVKVSGVVKEKCYNPAGKLVEAHSKEWDFSEKESVYIGKLHGDEKFYVEVDIDDEDDKKGSCPNENWTSKRKVVVEDVHVKIVKNDDHGDERKTLETADCEFKHHSDEAWCDYDDNKK
jgi:hypothetical protein